MTESELKEEIKRLKEKLKKKSEKVKELISKNERLISRWENLYKSSQEKSEKLWTIMNSFPNKYYRVEWSGDCNGLRKIELKKGICAYEVISELQIKYKNAVIHMIEEVAT